MALQYRIPLEEGKAFFSFIANEIQKAGLEVKRNPKKEYTLEIHVPHNMYSLSSQFGAIQYGGDGKKIEEQQAIAYVELRFYRKALQELQLLEAFDEIKEYREDSVEAIRFRFHEADTEKSKEVIEVIAMIFKQKFALKYKTALDTAIEWAAKAHETQYRKGTDTPYVSHPYAVGMMLAQAGCEEEVIIAGILHDTVEDTEITLEDIRREFGSRVAEIVEGCSEPNKELPWEERKQHTLDYLRTAPVEVCMVACADKLHNIRSIVAEYEVQGERIWERFNRGKEKQAWYYRGLVDSLKSQLENEKIYSEFKRWVEKIFL